MPQENLSEYLNPSRFPRMAFGLKANSTLNRITLTPSNANPGETLYIEIPKLTENMVIVPGSVFLVFNLTISGHENNTVVNNISRNLVKRQRVVFGGETLQDTTNYDLFQTYHDLFLSKEERENMLRHGISSENMRKLRTNAGDKDTSNAKEVAMATLHNTKYCIPLDHPILTDHGVFYPKSLPHPLKFEISLAPVRDVVVFFDTTKSPTYTITNLELEYRCISSKFLADKAQAAYKTNHAFFYENILHYKTFIFSKPNVSVINEQINVPRRSMTGILLLFTKNPTAGERDSGKFVNPDIKSVQINIDGVPNMLYYRQISGSQKSNVSHEVWNQKLRKQNFTQKTSLLCGLISGVTPIMKFTDRGSL